MQHSQKVVFKGSVMRISLYSDGSKWCHKQHYITWWEWRWSINLNLWHLYKKLSFSLCREEKNKTSSGFWSTEQQSDEENKYWQWTKHTHIQFKGQHPFTCLQTYLDKEHWILDVLKIAWTLKSLTYLGISYLMCKNVLTLNVWCSFIWTPFKVKQPTNE